MGRVSLDDRSVLAAVPSRVKGRATATAARWAHEACHLNQSQPCGDRVVTVCWTSAEPCAVLNATLKGGLRLVPTVR